MIVLEGPDGAGKTTLLNKLADRYQLPIAQRVVDKDTNAMVDLKRWVETNAAAGFQATLFDRHRLLSEPVYGPLMGRSAVPGFDSVPWMIRQHDMFWRCRPIVIYCLPHLEVVRHNVDQDPDNAAVAKVIDQVHFSYVAQATNNITTPDRAVAIFDYTVDNMTHLNAWLTRHMKDRGMA